MHYKYNRISKDVVDHCLDNKIIDGNLMTYWLRPGYDRLCSTLSVDTANSKFSTVSVCRVPAKVMDTSKIVENPMTGCRGCASGATTKNIFGNKYGEYLADIQVARELRAKAKAVKKDEKDEDEDESDEGSPARTTSPWELLMAERATTLANFGLKMVKSWMKSS